MINKVRSQAAAIGKLVQPQLPALPTTAQRLRSARDVEDLRRLARRRAPGFVYDYVAGGAYREESVACNAAALARRRLVPNVLRPVTALNTVTSLLGVDHRLPVGLAPTGLTGLAHPDGEIAVARAASRFGVPMGLSTMATRSIEEVAAAAPQARRWFQLYLRTDREKSLDLVRRAMAAGYDTLILTVDTPVAGRRLRDERNGLSLPPKLTVKTALDVARHPRWGVDFLTTPPPRLANFDESAASISELVNGMFDPGLSLRDLDWLREVWPGTLMVKGILNPQDAVAVFEHGADAVCVSNHGGRQLDRAIAPVDALPAIRAAVGPQAPLVLDSGITSGLDVVTALAAGADFVLVGRAFLYGLMAGGQAGVERVLDILSSETRNAMQLMGAASVADIRRARTHQPATEEKELIS